jgi:hypothetical protein
VTSYKHRLTGVGCVRGAKSRSSIEAWAPASPSQFASSASSSQAPQARTAQAALAMARRTADRREPGSNTRAITCHSASVPARGVPSALSIPKRRATWYTQSTPHQKTPLAATGSRLEGPQVLQGLLGAQRQPHRFDLSGGTMTDIGHRAVEDLPVGAIRHTPQLPRRGFATTAEVRGIAIHRGYYYNIFIQCNPEVISI